jgi:hypothetical protein
MNTGCKYVVRLALNSPQSIISEKTELLICETLDFATELMQLVISEGFTTFSHHEYLVHLTKTLNLKALS